MEKKSIVVDITKDIKRRDMMLKIEDWWNNNKQYVAIAIPVIGVIVGKSIKAISKHNSLKIQERLKDFRCWDASIGHYWELRRKLSNDDWLYINRRKSNGEALGDILKSLGVLK